MVRVVRDMAYSIAYVVREEASVVKLLTPDEVVAELKVSKAALYRWVSEGRLTPTRVGRRLRFSEDAIAAFLRSGDVASSPPSR